MADEKELTRHYDRVNAGRRRLPMVKVEKDYAFDGPSGKTSLKDLFEGRRQLIVYHFMFDQTWDNGCSGCTSFVSALGDLSLLNNRDTERRRVESCDKPANVVAMTALTEYRVRRTQMHFCQGKCMFF